MSASPSEQEYAGARFGLPAEGSGSVAGWGRRVLAIALDWLLSMMFVAAFVGSAIWGGGGFAQWGPLAVFGVQRWVLTTLLGASAGQLVMGLHVMRTGGGRLDVGRALVRTALVCLVLPAVIANADRQGLHDMAADSIVVRR